MRHSNGLFHADFFCCVAAGPMPVNPCVVGRAAPITHGEIAPDESAVLDAVLHDAREDLTARQRELRKVRIKGRLL